MTMISSGLTLLVLLGQGLIGLAGPGQPAHRAEVLVVAGSPVVSHGQACVVRCQGDPPNVISSRRLLAKDPRQPSADVQKLPPQYLGVRLTPVPEPLAAHIGEHGMMIANVAKGSPADQAGLQQYDVIVSLDSQEVTDSEDLFAALEDVKVGQNVPLAVIRGAQKKELTITPAERPTNPQVEWKYEEPDADVVEGQMQLRGHKLVPGPGGAWQWQELGPMSSFPDILPDLGLPDFNVNIQPFFEQQLDQDAQAHIEIRVQVDKDGGTLTIWRDKDGKINVKRVDPAGKESSATYQDMDDFRQSDPDAFRAYEPYSDRGGLDSWTIVRPRREQLGKLRQDFQAEVESKLREALDRARAAEEEAGKAVERMRERLEQYRNSPKPENGGNATEQRTVIQKSQRLSVNVDNGQIEVMVDDGDGPQTYRFQSKEEFKQQKPELYERCRQLLE